jgi:hypothetical protein
MEDNFPVGKAFDRTAVYRFMNEAEMMLETLHRQDSGRQYYELLGRCYESLLCSCVEFPLKSSHEVIVDHSYFTPFLGIVEAFLSRAKSLDELAAEQQPDVISYRRAGVEKTYLSKKGDMIFGARARTKYLLDKIDRHIAETDDMENCHGIDSRTRYAVLRENLACLLDGLEFCCNTATLLNGGFEPRPSPK